MITIDKIERHGYTVVVDGNGGEEQLVIVSSFGQHGGVPFEVIAAQVDGGVHRLGGRAIGVNDKPEEVRPYLTQLVQLWCGGGDLAQVQKVVRAFFEEGEYELYHESTVRGL